MRNKVLALLTLFIFINSVTLVLIYKYVDIKALFLVFANLCFVFLLRRCGMSKDGAIYLTLPVIVIVGLSFFKIYQKKYNSILTQNNYSLLGVVQNIKSCRGYRTDYYSAETIYLTQVEGRKFHDFHIPWYDYDTKVKIQIGDTILFRKYFDEYDCQVISWHPSTDTLQLFQKPVKYLDGEEIGNDYYYYARLRTHNALKNFGLNVVFKGLCHADTTLFCRNVNLGIDSVARPLADTLQTATNRALVGSSFAFLFHDGIYTKEQVFEEIPQAKEYYLKYCKETDSATNIISDTTTNTP